MAYATVSAKGQITLPANARRAVGIKPRDRVLIEINGDSIVVRPAPDFFALKGFLGKGLSPEEEQEAMMQAVAAKCLDTQQ